MELHKIYNDTQEMLTAFAQSRIGGRGENQDSYGWADTALGYLVTVCDGMGGGPGGKTASMLAVEEIVTCINQEKNVNEDPKNVVVKAICSANTAIIKMGKQHQELRGMGSTATVLLVSPQSAIIAHVGDSRVYQLKGRNKVFRTFDHSLVFEMVKQGVITEEQARLSAQSNVITRALGIKDDIEVEVHEVAYEKGDRFLLCTDGIHGSMSETDLIKLAGSHKHPIGVIVDNLATTTDNIGRTNGGGHDNLTLALIEMKTNSKLTQPMNKKAKLTILILSILLGVSLVGNVTSWNTIAPVENPMDSTYIQRYDSLQKQHQETIGKIKGLEEQVKNPKAFRDSITSLVEKWGAITQ